jgi:hypothetical protein
MTKRSSGDDKISTSFKIPKSLHINLKVAAAREEREMGDLVEDALRAYLKTKAAR